MIDAKHGKWMLEYFTPHEAHLHGIKDFIVSIQTPFQAVDIVETYDYGRALLLDSKMQSAEADEFIYHELLIHPALICHPAPKSAFVVGGGEGAALREIYRYPTIEKLYMVDIDEQVVRLCEKHLPEWNAGAFTDSRTILKFQDARAFLENTKEKFDLIVIDITEPMEGGPSYLLFTKEFYQLVNGRLTDDGLISLQAASTSPIWIECHACIIKTLREVFPVVRSYQGVIPSFDAVWGFGLGSKKYDPAALSAQEVDQRLVARGITQLKHFEGPIHSALFALPRYMRDSYDRLGRVIEDQKPIFLSI